jgi:ribosomal protein L37AE/L43A
MRTVDKIEAGIMNGNKFHCENCGAEEEVLLSLCTRKKFDGSTIWVCESCFKDIEGVSFQDYGKEMVAAAMGRR